MNNCDLEHLYQNNERFRLFVDRYSRHHNQDRYKAMNCIIIREYAEYIENHSDIEINVF